MKKRLWILIIVILLLFCCCSKNRCRQKEPYICDYPMCRYEKENVDTIIIEHAKESQVVMFGEIHDTVFSDSPPPIEDSRYVISLLPRLKKIGYRYLALEVNADEKEKGHSRDIVRFYNDCMNGKAMSEKEYACAKPGWIELLKSAMDLGYRIKFIDTPAKCDLFISFFIWETFNRLHAEP